MHRRRFLAALSTGSLASVAGCSDRRLEFGESSADGPPRPRVDGRWLLDPDGNPIVLRGVSAVDPVWGVEQTESRGKDYWETLELATDASAGWHARVLRIPIEPRSIRTVGLDVVVEEYLDRAVEFAAEKGVYALVDYHAIERYDTPSIDRRLRAFWNRVAPRYADESHVLYELFSAPSEPASGGIEAWRTWRDHASPWVSRIRTHAPDTPVVVGSPAWSSMTAYAAEEPFEHDEVLYSAHIYPSWDPRSWEPAFGTPAFDVPVFVTEWGYANVETARRADHVVGTTEEWGEPFREWVDAHENVHWCATTFDTSRQPAMFDDDWAPLDGNDYMGALVKDWLAERRDDHQPGEPTAIPTDEGSPPAPPSSINILQVNETGATAWWSTVRDSDGDDALQYRVTVDGRDPEILRGVEQSTELRDLEPGRSYEVSVTAVDKRGLESEPTVATFRTLERGDPEAMIPRTDTPPTIDGNDAEWPVGDTHPVNLFLWGDRAAEIAAGWRAAWDENALYVLVDVIDRDWGDGRPKTTVDLYLDLDNSGEKTYDGENDLQFLVERGTERVDGGSHSLLPSEGTVAGTVETDDGWRTELAIPWTEYGIQPIVGHRFGMDVHVIIGDRSAKIGWFDESDEAWENPGALATVELDE
ncbi:cellulase family glycosylhydrolase [Halomontanus rarus]|uniref:cellulase family glycosylhydrolase n=1 Tax=Halomontanus rarus TaxID=3034020 RepID=UPI001A98BA11